MSLFLLGKMSLFLLGKGSICHVCLNFCVLCVRAGLYRSIILDDVLKLKCLHAELLAKRCKEQSEKVCGLHAVGLAVWSCIVGRYATYVQADLK